MARNLLDLDFSHLQNEILSMGNQVELAVQDSTLALFTRNLNASNAVIRQDREINRMWSEIQKGILITIATQQPAAHDLRLLAATLNVTTELERIGDYAKGIAKINLRLGTGVPRPPIPEISEMAGLGTGMLHRALEAFVTEDHALAAAIAGEDDRVDELYRQVIARMAAEMAANPQAIQDSNYYLWAAHNLERLADRVTNICEQTIFAVTGEIHRDDCHLTR